MNEIILFDLDHTLYEAYNTWRNPLQQLFREHCSITRFPWKMYFKLRDFNNVFDLLYQKSFRHHWLTSELASLLLLLIEKRVDASLLFDELERIDFRLRVLRHKYPRPGMYRLSAMATLADHKVFQKTVQLAQDICNARSVRALTPEYYNMAAMTPHDGVVQCFDFLSTEGYRFYLATEGDYKHQIFKIKRLSLQSYFKGKILASEFYLENPSYQSALRTITTAVNDGSYGKKFYSKEIIHADETVRMFEMLKHKEHYFYYYALCHAIASDADTPEKVLLQSKAPEHLLSTDITPESKVLMVGDRNDKDMVPLWKIFQSACYLIRIKAGVYKDEKLKFKIPKRNYAETKNFRGVLSRLKKELKGGYI
ncbi:MAG: hypothetical protein EPO24_16005 [Bacteroidetes bacterium]|nr:MAG: hypothetical protein EPO24_16005 [Bacteroidota bacterium]